MKIYNYTKLEKLVQEEKYKEAEAFCREALVLTDDLHFWNTQLGYIYFLNDKDINGYYNQPIETFEALVLEDDKDANAHFWLGYFYTILQFEHEKFKIEMQKVLNLEPNHPYANLVLAGFSDTDNDEKIKFLKRVLELQPNNYRALTQLANVFLEVGHHNEAFPLLEMMLNQPPYVEQTYGIMNEYINDVITSATYGQTLRADAQLKLSQHGFPALPKL